MPAEKTRHWRCLRLLGTYFVCSLTRRAQVGRNPTQLRERFNTFFIATLTGRLQNVNGLRRQRCPTNRENLRLHVVEESVPLSPILERLL